MTYKYTKCESVIAKIMSDGGIEGTHFRVTDIREWIFEAIEKIGAPVQYIERESGVDGCPILKIEDYQVPIPGDLEHLSAVAYSPNEKGPWYPARTNNSTFKTPRGKEHDHHGHHVEDCMYCDDGVTEFPRPVDINERPIPHKPITSTCQLYEINGMKYAEKAYLNGAAEDVTFFTKPGWIVVNRKNGFVKLAYKAIATDERGYPLIPDSAAYQEAIYWYVMMKLNFKKFLNGKLGGGKAAGASMQIYQYLQNQWEYYKKQAYGEAMMPNEADMRGIKNEWTKLIPDWDSDEFLFKNEGRKQLNYTDYYYGY